MYVYVKNIYIYIKTIHRWDTGTQLQWRVTNMARNDLRVRGAWGGGREAPHQLGVGVARSATPTACNIYEPIRFVLSCNLSYYGIFFYVVRNKNT